MFLTLVRFWSYGPYEGMRAGLRDALRTLETKPELLADRFHALNVAYEAAIREERRLKKVRTVRIGLTRRGTYLLFHTLNQSLFFG